MYDYTPKLFPFIKMQAQGNDFIILDGRHHALPDMDAGLIRQMADRRIGIGCDQVLLIEPSDHADVRMRIFNQNGLEAENCGNGLRCVGALLLEESGATSVFIALAHHCVVAEKGNDGIRVHMGKADIEARGDAYVDVNIGNPHRVFFAKPDTMPADRNVEIVTKQTENHIHIDIIERGAGHTPACGSGACATAAAIWVRAGQSQPQTIHMPGGTVQISGTLEDMILEGAVAKVFTGIIPRSCK